MKRLVKLLTTVIMSLVFANCNNNNEKTQNKTDNAKTVNALENPDKKEDSLSRQSPNFKLLQGKWQHDEDKTNFLVFEGNQRKEIAEGLDEWDIEEFILSDHCQNETDEKGSSPEETDSYISCKDSDLCWYIMSLSPEVLTLQYMARGNTLIYHRVKK
jgi:hypothetical protein